MYRIDVWFFPNWHLEQLPKQAANLVTYLLLQWNTWNQFGKEPSLPLGEAALPARHKQTPTERSQMCCNQVGLNWKFVLKVTKQEALKVIVLNWIIQYGMRGTEFLNLKCFVQVKCWGAGFYVPGLRAGSSPWCAGQCLSVSGAVLSVLWCSTSVCSHWSSEIRAAALSSPPLWSCWLSMWGPLLK